MTDIVLGPASKKQKMFLTSDATIVIYGGGAGSGKSWCSLMKALEGVHHPQYRAVFIRQNRTQLRVANGLWQNAEQMYAPFVERMFTQTLRAKFPSGAEISFAGFHHPSEKRNFDSSQYSLVTFDEAQWAHEENVLYLLSRIRNAGENGPKKQLVLTCNPLKDTYLHRWIEWHLDPETGIPDRSKDGVIRYFVNDTGKVHIYLTKEEALEKHPHLSEEDLLTVTYISALVYDNPVLMKNDPGYVSRLKGLPRVEQERLLWGSWTASAEASGYFKKEWMEPVRLHEQEIVSYCRAWDIAGSLPTEDNPNPDYTAGVLMAKTKQGRYIIVDVVRFRQRYGEVIKRIIETAANDPEGTRIILPQEPGQAGKAAGQMMIADIVEAGFSARMRPTNKSKVIRFQPFAAAAEAGLVSYVEDDWNNEYFNELEGFDGSRRVKDDMVDSTSDAFITLAQSLRIPDMSSGLLGTLSKNRNPFKQ